MKEVKHKVTLCTKCGLACGEAEYKVHVENNCQTVKCSQCPQYYTSAEGLLRHTKAVHEKQFSCTICKIDYASKYNLKRHMGLIHNEINNKKPIECEQCGEIFVTKYFRKRHIQRVHNKEFVCTTCKQEFSTIYMFKAHMERKHKDQLNESDETKSVKVYQVECPKCNKRIAKSGLERHMRDKHSKVFTCHICQRECPTEKALHKHIDGRHPEEHSEEALLKKKFKCPHCPQRYSDKWTLKIHVKGIHEQQFKCEMCEQSFAVPHSLIRHKLKIHGVEIDYETVMKNLTPSEEDATSSKKFKCPQCPKGFSFSWGLKQHIKGKHEQQYKCEICNKLFSRKFPLEKHKLNVHKLNSGNETTQIKTEASKNGFKGNEESDEDDKMPFKILEIKLKEEKVERGELEPKDADLNKFIKEETF